MKLVLIVAERQDEHRSPAVQFGHLPIQSRAFPMFGPSQQALIAVRSRLLPCHASGISAAPFEAWYISESLAYRSVSADTRA